MSCLNKYKLNSTFRIFFFHSPSVSTDLRLESDMSLDVSLSLDRENSSNIGEFLHAHDGLKTPMATVNNVKVYTIWRISRTIDTFEHAMVYEYIYISPLFYR